MSDMKYHNEDIAACTNDKCEKTLSCLRWQIGTNKDPYQTYLDGDMCGGEFYVELKDKENSYESKNKKDWRNS